MQITSFVDARRQEDQCLNHLFKYVFMAMVVYVSNGEGMPCLEHVRLLLFIDVLFKKRFKETGRLMLIPNTFALTAVHRQTAASRSSKPWMRLQHGLVGTLPSSTSTKLNRLRHTPRFKGLHV
ncbi:hypothetical protein GQ457_14G019720 [Hibiscus cannabinus]